MILFDNAYEYNDSIVVHSENNIGIQCAACNLVQRGGSKW
jgi:hypothetical protein